MDDTDKKNAKVEKKPSLIRSAIDKSDNIIGVIERRLPLIEVSHRTYVLMSMWVSPLFILSLFEFNSRNPKSIGPFGFLTAFAIVLCIVLSFFISLRKSSRNDHNQDASDIDESHIDSVNQDVVGLLKEGDWASLNEVKIPLFTVHEDKETICFMNACAQKFYFGDGNGAGKFFDHSGWASKQERCTIEKVLAADQKYYDRAGLTSVHKSIAAHYQSFKSEDRDTIDLPACYFRPDETKSIFYRRWHRLSKIYGERLEEGSPEKAGKWFVIVFLIPVVEHGGIANWGQMLEAVCKHGDREVMDQCLDGLFSHIKENGHLVEVLERLLEDYNYEELNCSLVKLEKGRR